MKLQLQFYERYLLMVYQMVWSAKVQKNAGLTTGEMTEQANSYLSRLGLTTRHMSKYGERQDDQWVTYYKSPCVHSSLCTM